MCLARIAKAERTSWAQPFFVVAALGVFLIAAMPFSVHAKTASDTAASTDSDEMVMPEIPDTVVVPDPVSLTVVLRDSGTIRQMVFNIWLEATSKQTVSVIEQRLPKVIDAFLVDLQRLMYRDTEQRFETREPGKRGFKYTAPALLVPPPPKTEEELEAERDAAEAAKEKGEVIAQEPPFTPFPPAPNRYFAALQNKLLRTGQKVLPPDTLRSVQIRMFYDFWPADAKKR